VIPVELSWLDPLFVAIGFGVGWCVKQLRVKTEIGKLKAETAKLKQETFRYAGENLEKRQQKRAAYNDILESSKQVVLKLINQLKSDSKSIAKTREELSTAVHHKAIPAYIELIEFEQLAKKDDPEQLKALIGEDVVVELRRICGWISIINGRRFVTTMNLTPAKIHKRTLAPFLQLLNDLPPKDKQGAEAEMLKKAVADIIQSGLTAD
jgi:hypothetical protein